MQPYRCSTGALSGRRRGKSRIRPAPKLPPRCRVPPFFEPSFHPICDRLAPESLGLDFGCGPGPTLSKMFEEAGHEVTLYDRFYADDKSVLKARYDFITTTEVVEHLHHPVEELDRLWVCLKKEGRLGIMTKLALNEAAFSKRHYKNDAAHGCFFSKKDSEVACRQVAGKTDLCRQGCADL